MRVLQRFALSLAGVVVATWGAASSGSPQQSGDPSPVVLELFTSQGCSSCPPADRVLSHLGMDAGLRGKVVPLAFHVDYWNRVGWIDPFSAPRWSQRQELYTRVFGPDRMYTPQLVVNGRTELNGSHQQRALAEIVAERRRPPAASVVLAARLGEGQPSVAVDASVVMHQDLRAGKLELLVALFENEVTTRVGSGENRGRTLENDFVVRRLETAFSIDSMAGARKQRAWNLKLDRKWRSDRLGVAAFLQDASSMKIYGAASQPLR